MICPKCGKENEDGSILCNGCGFHLDTSGPLSETETHVEEKSEGRVKFIIKSKKEHSKQTPSFDKVKKNPEKNPISIGVKRNRYFSNESNSEVRVDLQKALEQEEKKPITVHTEYQNRFIKEMPPEASSSVDIIAPDPTKSTISLIIMTALAVLITVLLGTKLKEIELYTNAIDNLKDLIGDMPLINVIPFLVYVGLIFAISFDSFKSRELSLRKSITKNVIASLIVSIVLTIIYNGFVGFTIADTYFSILIRFIITLIILELNNYFKKFYYDIENKLGIRNILFEFLIYYDLFTLLLFIFG